MKKKNLSAILGIILGILCVICVILALFLSKKPSELPDHTLNYVTEQYESFSEKTEYQSPVDFKKLQNESSDIFAWINIENTDIDYPVLFHEGDNSYYLRRNIYGEYDRNGSLFIEDYNKTDFNDPVTIIYGHHMSSGAMFGKLQQIYTNPETFRTHNKIKIYTPEKEVIYRIFCAVPLDNSHILHYNNFNNSIEFEQFFENVYSTRSFLSVYDETVKITPEDKVLMLSTCFETDYSRRYVVMAVCEEEIN